MTRLGDALVLKAARSGRGWGLLTAVEACGASAVVTREDAKGEGEAAVLLNVPKKLALDWS